MEDFMTIRRWSGFLFILSYAVSILPAQAGDTPYQLYEKALTAIARYEYHQAIDLLHRSILEVPPRLQDSNQMKAKYIPYYYLALSYARTGNFEAAEVFLDLAKKRGYCLKYPELQRELQTLEDEISGRSMQTKPPVPPPPPQPLPTKKDDQDHEPERVEPRDNDLKGCLPEPSDDPYDLPWYFHYALGKELFQRELYHESLRNFTRAIMENPNPSPKARTYGMWFLSYRPYYYVTRAFVHLKKLHCARLFARESLRYGEIPENDKESRTWRRLLRKLQIDYLRK